MKTILSVTVALILIGCAVPVEHSDKTPTQEDEEWVDIKYEDCLEQSDQGSDENGWVDC